MSLAPRAQVPSEGLFREWAGVEKRTLGAAGPGWRSGPCLWAWKPPCCGGDVCGMQSSGRPGGVSHSGAAPAQALLESPLHWSRSKRSQHCPQLSFQALQPRGLEPGLLWEKGLGPNSVASFPSAWTLTSLSWGLCCRDECSLHWGAVTTSLWPRTLRNALCH